MKCFLRNSAVLEVSHAGQAAEWSEGLPEISKE